VLKRLHWEKTDANLILSALEIGTTRTEKPGRGKGLDQMHDVIRQAGGGYMRIMSGRGDVTVKCDGKPGKRQLSSHIGGTMIEWSIPIKHLIKEDEGA